MQSNVSNKKLDNLEATNASGKMLTQANLVKEAWVLELRPAALANGKVSASKLVISTLDFGRNKGVKKAADPATEKADPEVSTGNKPADSEGPTGSKKDETATPTEIAKAWKV